MMIPRYYWSTCTVTIRIHCSHWSSAGKGVPRRRMPLENTPRGAEFWLMQGTLNTPGTTSSSGATRSVARRRRGGQSIRAGSSRQMPGKHPALHGSASQANSGSCKEPDARIFATLWRGAKRLGARRWRGGQSIGARPAGKTSKRRIAARSSRRNPLKFVLYPHRIEPARSFRVRFASPPSAPRPPRATVARIWPARRVFHVLLAGRGAEAAT